MEKLRVFSTRREHEKNEAYLADAIAALFGSILGVSTVATFAESTAGVADGAKTGGFRRCPVDGEEKSWIFFGGVNSNCSKFQTPKMLKIAFPWRPGPLGHGSLLLVGDSLCPGGVGCSTFGIGTHLVLVGCLNV